MKHKIVHEFEKGEEPWVEVILYCESHGLEPESIMDLAEALNKVLNGKIPGENGIREKRISANISQDELAKMLNVTQGAVSQWEDGSCLPRADKLLELARLLKCDVKDLLKEV